VDNFQHAMEGFAFDAEESFEFSIAECQCFLYALGLDDRWLSRKKEKMLLKNNTLCIIIIDTLY